MIYFNLGWLAYPCWLVAAYFLIAAVSWVPTLLNGRELMPYIAAAAIEWYVFYGICLAGLGGLLWKAFLK